ncbi:helix-hairpin-helix domain-containing protein [Pseudomonas sp. GD03842]|uniref:ComEA family DNA-binding protein n=1 Tax=Pseudomonas sp. GD03842 TaxID=2975385 RepID=UPI00244AAA6C|nr:helix-hairpin-helix domain-containing protein [Pseudomonas sp. GD03842]MDH0748207.1 helix-hairpin-helix domain-containing protein [Pseudomonas sp. GD03842]
MRMPYLSSLLFALIASTSIAATAAPAALPSQPPAAATATAAAEQSGKVNLNSANAETLQKELSGIGASKAAAIVAYREENGAFTSVDELIEVKGIGKALLDKNRDKLALE